MIVKGLKETIVRRDGNKEVYEYAVKNIGGSKYEVPELGFTFNAETGETSKGRGIKIGETFKSACREITYTLITEEEPKADEQKEEQKKETKAENPTLVETVKWSDGQIETKEYELKDWKGIRYYIQGLKDAYVDKRKNTVVLSRSRSYELGKEYECRGPRKNYTLTYIIKD